jgi:hypothetical protein
MSNHASERSAGLPVVRRARRTQHSHCTAITAAAALRRADIVDGGAARRLKRSGVFCALGWESA